MRAPFAFSFLVSFVLGTASAASATATFSGLGLLPGSSGTEGYAVSSDGSTVVGHGTTNPRQGFRWTAETGVVPLGDLPGDLTSSRAWAVSPDGSVVVGDSRGFTGEEAFRWTSDAGMSLLWSGFGGNARGISDDGNVVVGGKAGLPVRWTESDGLEFLPILKTTSGSGSVHDVSADGSVAVGVSDSDLGRQAAFWTEAGGVLGLGDLVGGNFESLAMAVSADGSTVVGWSESASGREAFRWSAVDLMLGLGDLDHGEFLSEALAVSGDGSVIVGRATGSAGAEAFIWDAENGMRSLEEVFAGEFGIDLTGWELIAATDITPDAQTIVGYGQSPSGSREAWIATIPEPSVAALVALGLLGIGMRSRPAQRV